MLKTKVITGKGHPYSLIKSFKGNHRRKIDLFEIDSDIEDLSKETFIMEEMAKMRSCKYLLCLTKLFVDNKDNKSKKKRCLNDG